MGIIYDAIDLSYLVLQTRDESIPDRITIKYTQRENAKLI